MLDYARAPEVVKTASACRPVEPRRRRACCVCTGGGRHRVTE